jgi:ribonuclease HI
MRLSVRVILLMRVPRTINHWVYGLSLRILHKYPFDARTDWVFHWRHNGFQDSEGRLVKNWSLLRELDCKSWQNEGIKVEFWLVLGPESQYADRLATVACV